MTYHLHPPLHFSKKPPRLCHATAMIALDAQLPTLGDLSTGFKCPDTRYSPSPSCFARSTKAAVNSRWQQVLSGPFPSIPW